LPHVIPHPRSTRCKPFSRMGRPSRIRRRAFSSGFPRKRPERSAPRSRGRFWWIRDPPFAKWCLPAPGRSLHLAVGVAWWERGSPSRSGSLRCGWSWEDPSQRKQLRNPRPPTPRRHPANQSRTRPFPSPCRLRPSFLCRFHPQSFRPHLHQARRRRLNPASRLRAQYTLRARSPPCHEPVVCLRPISSDMHSRQDSLSN